MPNDLHRESITEIVNALADAKATIQAVATMFSEFNDKAERGEVATQELAIALFNTKDAHGELDDAVKLIYHQVERINKGLLPKRLRDSDTDLIRVPSVARSFSIRTNYSASFLDKEKGFEWLRETGNESLISETVNAGTLASFCRNMLLEEGVEPPADIVKLSSYDAISITKYTPKPGAVE